jgi:hypothetical protein
MQVSVRDALPSYGSDVPSHVETVGRDSLIDAITDGFEKDPSVQPFTIRQ